MAIVDNLPSISSTQSSDEMPIERGTLLYKITPENLLAKAPNSASLNLTQTTWPNLYAALIEIDTNKVACFRGTSDAISKLTGAKVAALSFGVVARLTDTIFEFMIHQANTAYIIVWRVTFSSDATTATVGTVYRLTGNAM